MLRCLLIPLLFSGASFGKDFAVTDADSLANAVSLAKPGDNLILREGEWRDVKIEFSGKGKPTAPIMLKAANPGKTIISGNSTLRIGGEHLVVEGLCFQDPNTSVSDLIQFRKDSKRLASNCRMTNCSVTSSLAADSVHESRWVGIYGTSNRVDHCRFQGKSGKGTTFVVWLANGSEGNHQIDHNYFGPREALGENGGETIRIGDSKNSMLDGKCVVEKNLFEKCNGEAECISNKSCANIYRDNSFIEVSGTITLRHGNRCLVERNVFLGNDARGTGGIRIIGEDHVVSGNYLERLTGDDGRSAICLMMGIPQSPANRYFQVQRARIEGNTIVDCKHSILIGLSDDEKSTLAPVETVFIGNQVSSPKVAIIEARCDLDGITWKDNRLSGKSLGIGEVTGIEATKPTLTRLIPISRNEVGTSW